LFRKLKLVEDEVEAFKIADEIGYPVIVKPPLAVVGVGCA